MCGDHYTLLTKHCLTVDNRFIIITPVYNAVKYIDECLDSLLSQAYDNYEICVIDDCSTDGTWNRILQKQNNSNARMNICRNEYRIGSPLANIVKGIELFALDGEDIVAIVDGDDSLSHNAVLSDLNEVYQDTGVYMTYGQFVPLSGKYAPYCKEITDTVNYRKDEDWRASHLKTFKRKLWDRIKDDDLRDKNGDYYKFIGDAAFMYPMVEMCGTEHMRFISKVNYRYNDLNPLNELTTNRSEQLRLSEEIWAKPCYKKVDKL